MNILYCMIYCFLDKSAQIVLFVSSTTFKDNEIANLFVFRDCFAIQFSLKCWGHALIQSEKFRWRHHQIDQACSKAKQGPIDTHLGCLHFLLRRHWRIQLANLKYSNCQKPQNTHWQQRPALGRMKAAETVATQRSKWQHTGVSKQLEDTIWKLNHVNWMNISMNISTCVKCHSLLRNTASQLWIDDLM